MGAEGGEQVGSVVGVAVAMILLPEEEEREGMIFGMSPDGVNE